MITLQCALRGQGRCAAGKSNSVGVCATEETWASFDSDPASAVLFWCVLSVFLGKAVNVITLV